MKKFIQLTRNFILALMLYVITGATVVWGEITIPRLEDLPKDGQLFKIISRGELVVGVKADYPPWGQYNSDGTQLVGLEVDLAKDLAERLGVDLRLVPVNSRNRLTKVEDGSVDLIIATMGDTSKRREQSGLLLPNYYSSGVTLLAPEASVFTDWNQLKGRRVCLTAGAYFNQTLIDRFLIKPVVFEGTRDTGLGLKSGQCVGWAYDNTSLEQQINSGEWEGYDFNVPVILSTPWALAVSKNERLAELGQFVSDVIEDWLRNGYILSLQEKWSLPESRYLADQKSLFSKKEDDDTQAYFCKRNVDGFYPLGCQSQQIIQSSTTLAEKSEFVKKLESLAGSRGIIRFLSPKVADTTKAPFELLVSVDGAEALGISLPKLDYTKGYSISDLSVYLNEAFSLSSLGAKATTENEGKYLVLSSKSRGADSSILLSNLSASASAILGADENGLGENVIHKKGANLLDFTSFYNPSVLQSLKTGALLTVLVSVSSMAGSILASIVLILGGSASFIILRWPFQTLIMICRSSPPLILMYLLFFGVGAYLFTEYQFSLSSVAAAITVFSLYAGAGVAGALLPTYLKERKPTELGDLGIRRALSRTYSSNIDAVVANCVNIVKATGMASAIAVPELITASNGVIANWGNSFTMMNVLLLAYFLYVLIVIAILKGFVRLAAKNA